MMTLVAAALLATTMPYAAERALPNDAGEVIRLTRGGDGQRFTLEFKSDGIARLDARRFDDLVGCFSGRIGSAQMRRAVRSITGTEYVDLPSKVGMQCPLEIVIGCFGTPPPWPVYEGVELSVQLARRSHSVVSRPGCSRVLDTVSDSLITIAREIDWEPDGCLWETTLPRVR